MVQDHSIEARKAWSARLAAYLLVLLQHHVVLVYVILFRGAVHTNSDDGNSKCYGFSVWTIVISIIEYLSLFDESAAEQLIINYLSWPCSPYHLLSQNWMAIEENLRDMFSTCRLMLKKGFNRSSPARIHGLCAARKLGAVLHPGLVRSCSNGASCLRLPVHPESRFCRDPFTTVGNKQCLHCRNLQSRSDAAPSVVLQNPAISLTESHLTARSTGAGQ